MVSLQNSDLISALGAVQKAVGSTYPTSGVFINIEEDLFYIQVTNLEISMRIAIECEVEGGEMELLVDHRTLYRLLSKISDEDYLYLSEEKDSLKVVSSTGEFYIATVSKDDYPQLDFKIPQKARSIEFPHSRMVRAAQVAKFASTEDLNKMNNICFDLRESLDFYATDAHVLARVSCVEDELDVKEIGEKVLIFHKTIPIVKAFLVSPEPVKMIVEDNRVIFYQKNRIATVQRSTVSYPDINPIYPDEFKVKCRFDIVRLKEMISRSEVFVNDSGSITVEVNETTEKLSIKSNSWHEVGKSSESISVSTDGDMAFAVNPRYFHKALDLMTGVDASLEYKSDTSPLKLSCDDGETHVIIMPVLNYG